MRKCPKCGGKLGWATKNGVFTMWCRKCGIV